MKILMNNPIASKNNKIENKNVAPKNNMQINKRNMDTISFSPDVQKYAEQNDLQVVQNQISDTLGKPASTLKLETLKHDVALGNYTVSSEKIANAILGYTKK